MHGIKFKLTCLSLQNFPKYLLFEAISIEWNNADSSFYKIYPQVSIHKTSNCRETEGKSYSLLTYFICLFNSWSFPDHIFAVETIKSRECRFSCAENSQAVNISVFLNL